MFRTKVIALVVLTVLLASVAAIGVASAQAETNSYYSTLILTGYGQVTSTGVPIEVGGMLRAAPYVDGKSTFVDGTVSLYAQKLGATAKLGTETKKLSEPVLKATVAAADWNSLAGLQSISFSEQGDYYVYAVFTGGNDAAGNYWKPSQSGMMAVKVITLPAPIKMQQPSLAFLMPNNDKQVAFVGDNVYVSGLFRSFGADGTLTTLTDITAWIYVQYKAPGEQTWGPAKLADKSVVQMGGHGAVYQVAKPGDYRFQMKFNGDKSYAACASNYVDVRVLTPTADQTSKLSLGIEPLSLSAGQSITLHGELKTSASTPQPIANAPISLEKSTDNVRWSSLDIVSFSVPTSSSGTYSTTTSIDSPGTYYIRAHYYGSSEYTETFSPVVTITVQPNT